jgi:NarL family two-component system response regulator LiaR
MDELIRILVVDDQSIVREGLCAMLATKPGFQVVGVAVDGDEAVEKALILNPDVILMDLMMPNKNGIMAMREIIEKRPNTRVLVLSNFSDEVQIVESMRAGAMGYMLKSAMPQDLVDAIHQVHAGETPLNPLVARRLVQTLTTGQPDVLLRDLLTEREMEIVRLVAEGRSNRDIAKELGISSRTVGTHVSNIMTKAKVDNRTQLALLALRQGIASLFPVG